MKTLLFIVAALFAAFAVIGGIYVSVWLCLVQGIIQIIHAVQATPLDEKHLAYGILRVVCSSLAGGVTFWLGMIMGAGCAGLAGSIKSKPAQFRGSFPPRSMNR